MYVFSANHSANTAQYHVGLRCPEAHLLQNALSGKSKWPVTCNAFMVNIAHAYVFEDLIFNC